MNPDQFSKLDSNSADPPSPEGLPQDKIMSTEKTISAESYEQLANTLNQIATDMNSIKKILDDAVSDGTFDHRCESIELMANRSGALADRMAEALGEPPLHGGLEAWFNLET